jgi:hypothetical protein
MHECGGEKSHAIFGISINETCTCNHDSITHEEDCCKDKKITVKAEKKDKNVSKQIVHTFKIIDLIYQDAVIYHFVAKTTLPIFTIVNRIEYPPGYARPLYIMYNSFLI